MAPKVRTEFHRPEAVKKHSPHTADREESPAAWISPIALGLGLLGLVFKVPPAPLPPRRRRHHTTTTTHTRARAKHTHASARTHARTHARTQTDTRARRHALMHPCPSPPAMRRYDGSEH
jgi:hypothetical protein